MTTSERIALGFVHVERLRRSDLPGAEVVDLDGLVLAFANVTAPELNSTLVEREPADAVVALQAAEEEFARRGRAFGLDLVVGRHPAVDAAVHASGLELLLERPGMVADIDRLPDARPPDGVRISRVRDETGAQALARTDAESFGSDLEVSERFYAPRAFGIPDAASFVAWDGDEPVGAVMGYFHAGAVGVFGVGVIPRARRRGVGAALTIAAARAFDGAEIAWLHPSQMALSLYEGAGFREDSRWQVLVRPPSTTVTSDAPGTP
jgi:ribosomal protein S18 acetylase RimI-like enzyme